MGIIYGKRVYIWQKKEEDGRIGNVYRRQGWEGWGKWGMVVKA